MDNATCFMLVATDRVRRSLRRYCSRVGNQCGDRPYRYHNAQAFYDEAIVPIGQTIELNVSDYRVLPSPTFPTSCEACGYQFADDDARQLFCDRIYVRADDPSVSVVIRDAPVGAMWWNEHMGDRHLSPKARARGGKQHLCVMTPGGEWDIDAPSNNGDGWDRTGEPPRITANPSILMPRYHGWLRDGVLVSC